MATNATIIESGSLLVLFSYATPVAYFDKQAKKAYKTTTKHSKTTTKHINQFFKTHIVNQHLSAFSVENVDQSFLNEKFPLKIEKL